MFNLDFNDPTTTLAASIIPALVFSLEFTPLISFFSFGVKILVS